MYSAARLAAMAVLCAGVAFSQKQYRDGEAESYNAVVKDLTANNFPQAVADLDAWKSKFPQTDFETDRDVLYVKSYVGAKQWANAIDKAGELFARGWEARFADPAQGPGQELQVLYAATVAIPMIADPTPQQMATGQMSAEKLRGFARRPPGVSDADWTKLRADVQGPAHDALVYLAMLPGNRAMTRQPRDCGAAVTAYTKALREYPESSSISYNLATALNCEKRIAEAVYEFQRAAVVDPTLGGTREPMKIVETADGAYQRVHGSKEGLEELKQLVKQSAMPPAGFALKTAADIEAEKEAAFEAGNPQLALWQKIKQALTAPGGHQYFETQLKNAAVPLLRGTLVGARPACRPKELLVAVSDAAQSEIALHLDTPLAGKPQAGTELQWEGVPSAFTSSPFLLTMDTPAKSIKGLKATACGTAPPRKK